MKNNWQPIETAPRDGRKLLMTDGKEIQVCYPKLFPRPIAGEDEKSLQQSKAGDRWEYFRHPKSNDTWSLTPTHWMELPELPTK